MNRSWQHAKRIVTKNATGDICKWLLFSGFQHFLYRDPLQQPTINQRPPSKTQIKQMCSCKKHFLATLQKQFTTSTWKALCQRLSLLLAGENKKRLKTGQTASARWSQFPLRAKSPRLRRCLASHRRTANDWWPSVAGHRGRRGVRSQFSGTSNVRNSSQSLKLSSCWSDTCKELFVNKKKDTVEKTKHFFLNYFLWLVLADSFQRQPTDWGSKKNNRCWQNYLGARLRPGTNAIDWTGVRQVLTHRSPITVLGFGNERLPSHFWYFMPNVACFFHQQDEQSATWSQSPGNVSRTDQLWWTKQARVFLQGQSAAFFRHRFSSEICTKARNGLLLRKMLNAIGRLHLLMFSLFPM